MKVVDEYCNKTQSSSCSPHSDPWSGQRPSNLPWLGLNASVLSAALRDSREEEIRQRLCHRPGVNCSIHLPHFYSFFCVSLFSLFRWLFYRSTCIVYAFCGVLFGLCSLSNLTVLSCVCWLKVCCPNYGKNNTTMSWVCSSVSVQGSWQNYWQLITVTCFAF